MAYKSNKSDYYINGKKSSFTEVGKLLEARGIDLHNNRFLILQGEVEQISLMKPKAQNPHEDGLLEYLEDIIGSNKYVKDIEEKSKLVDELSQNRNEKLNRVKVVEKEKDSLEEAKAEAEEYMKKEREYLCKKVIEYQLNQYEAQKSRDQLLAKKTTLDEKMKEFKERELSNKDKVDSLEKEYGQAQSAHDGLVSRQKTQKKDFTKFEKKDIQYRENLQHLERSMKKLEESIQSEMTKMKKQSSLAAKKTDELAGLNNEASAAKERKKVAETTLEKFYASLQHETEPLRAQLETKQKELAPLTKAKIEKQGEVEVVQTEIQILEQGVNSAKEAYALAEKELEDIKKAIVDDPKEKSKLTSKLTTVKQNIKTLLKRQQDLSRAEEKSNAFLRENRPKLESSKSLQAAKADRSTMLQELEEARQGVLGDAGLHGRLGDLGEIESKYDVAVSTACPGLDYLVTETTKGAEKCVKYLRQRQLGRATFAILEKFNGFQEQMKQKPTPAPRLFDLIKVRDPKFKRAFYFAMRDTLVTETLDQAVKIAYNGNKCVWRVVTLDGTVIDKAGTMSGGGKRTKRGGMWLAGKETALGHKCAKGGMENVMTKEEMVKLEKHIAHETEKLAEIRKQTKEVKLELIEAGKEKDMLEMSLEKLNIKSASRNQEVDHVESKLKTLKPKCTLSAKDKKTLAKLNKDMEAKKKALEAAAENAKCLEDECAEIQDKILNVGGKKATELKTAVDAAAEEAESTAKSLRKTKLAIKAHEKKVDACNKHVEEAQGELEELKTKESDLKSDFKQIEEEAFTVMQSLSEIENALNSSKRELGLLKAEYTSLKSSFNKSEQQLVVMQNQMDVYNDEDKVCEERVVTWKKKREEVEKKFTSFLEFCPKEMISENGEDGPAFAKLPEVSSEDIESDKYDKQEIIEQAAELKKDVDALKKNVNMGSIEEYRKRDAEYTERVKELDEATKQRDEARDDCDELRKKRLDEFMHGFSTITLKLKEMYQMITMGGDAELELVDSLDPFSEGIVFSVRPPKKSWKNISNLSGGEKTLSSLALVFALHHYNPTPLYVMDEIDAALDFKNVSIVANYIKERTKNAQFIIISLRNNMFELADRLVGIYKTHNATKSITINPGKIVEKQIALKGEKPMQDRTNLSTT